MAATERTKLFDLEREGSQHLVQGRELKEREKMSRSDAPSFKQNLLEDQTKLWIFSIAVGIIFFFCLISLYGLNPTAEKSAPFSSQDLMALNISTDLLTLRWGIVGLGRISDDFAVALLIAGANLTAVAAGSLPHSKSRSITFGQKFGVLKERCYDNYEELAADPDVDIVYIGNTNQLHYHTALLMIDRSKHVLVEKVLNPSFSYPSVIHQPIANSNDSSRN
jgi:hypothetical protein